MKAINKLYFVEISLNVRDKKREYEVAQLFNLFNQPSIDQIEHERVLSQELHALILDEENFFRQKVQDTKDSRGKYEYQVFSSNGS